MTHQLPGFIQLFTDPGPGVPPRRYPAPHGTIRIVPGIDKGVNELGETGNIPCTFQFLDPPLHRISHITPRSGLPLLRRLLESPLPALRHCGPRPLQNDFASSRLSTINTLYTRILHHLLWRPKDSVFGYHKTSRSAARRRQHQKSARHHSSLFNGNNEPTNLSPPPSRPTRAYRKTIKLWLRSVGSRFHV